VTEQQPTAARDELAVARFVEQFALLFSEAGVPRMPARVFALLLVTDSRKRTAGQLAEELKASPAAISGAVRYLDQVGLATKRRDPGERRDHYEVVEDVWYEAYAHREKQLSDWARALDEGAAAVGPHTPAGRRLTESSRFFDFLRTELPALMAKWRAQEGS
jgi:DNA-binding transcriptional regulator GbsR (MarR family)